MQPSEVRDHVLSDHVVLRHDLEQLEALSARVADVAEEGRVAADALRQAAERFLAKLERHMRWEEAYLLPALYEADAWGRERAQHLVDDHREQRELLTFILKRLRDRQRPNPVLACDVAGLIALLREDMREEEAELLDERVLRDDVIGIEVEAG